MSTDVDVAVVVEEAVAQLVEHLEEGAVDAVEPGILAVHSQMPPASSSVAGQKGPISKPSRQVADRELVALRRGAVLERAVDDRPVPRGRRIGTKSSVSGCAMAGAATTSAASDEQTVVCRWFGVMKVSFRGSCGLGVRRAGHATAEAVAQRAGQPCQRLGILRPDPFRDQCVDVAPGRVDLRQEPAPARREAQDVAARLVRDAARARRSPASISRTVIVLMLAGVMSNSRARLTCEAGSIRESASMMRACRGRRPISARRSRNCSSTRSAACRRKCKEKLSVAMLTVSMLTYGCPQGATAILSGDRHDNGGPDRYSTAWQRGSYPWHACEDGPTLALVAMLWSAGR